MSQPAQPRPTPRPLRPPAAPLPRLPAYALYGEQTPGPPVDRLHCESIAERSRLHDWEIRPHRHETLFQLLVLARGRAEARLDGERVLLDGPALITVPALAAHGFHFAPDVDGAVFTVDQRHLQALLAGDAGLRDALLRLRAWPLEAGGEGTPALLAAAGALLQEVHGDAPWRGVAIDAALLRLLVAVARAGPAAPPAAGALHGRAVAHVQRFRALVDALYRAPPSLVTLAGQVGITPTQLNRVCRQVLGHSALGVLHARQVLEAQRELAYTAMSVKQIALGLGFSDAAYFTRFFLRRTGHTPTAWRTRGHALGGMAGAAAPPGD